MNTATGYCFVYVGKIAGLLLYHMYDMIVDSYCLAVTQFQLALFVQLYILDTVTRPALFSAIGNIYVRVRHMFV